MERRFLDHIERQIISEHNEGINRINGLDGKIRDVMGLKLRVISESLPFFSYAEMLRSVENSIEGYNRFKEYSENVDFGNHEPDIIIENPMNDLSTVDLTEKLKEPKLECFSKDDRIVIYPMNSYKSIFTGPAVFEVENEETGKVEIIKENINFKMHNEFNQRTSYIANEKPNYVEIIVERLPHIVDSSNSDELIKYSTIANNVLGTRLQPYTKKHIVADLEDYFQENLDTYEQSFLDIPSEDFKQICKSRILEQNLVSQVLIYDWLRKDKKTEELRSVLNYNFNQSDTKSAYITAREMKMSDIIDWYKDTKSWNFNDFLKGKRK